MTNANALLQNGVTTCGDKGSHVLGLGLAGLDAQLADVELAVAPPVGPAEVGILLPAQLNDHQVADVRVRGQQEGDGGVTVQHRPAGGGGRRGRAVKYRTHAHACTHTHTHTHRTTHWLPGHSVCVTRRVF